MMMHLDRHTHLLEDQAHLGAHVLEGINRRDREIAALDRRAMGQIAAFEVQPGRPAGLFRVDLDTATRHVDVPGHRIENEKLGLRAEKGRITDAGRFQVSLGTLGQRARIAIVALAIGRFDDVAAQDQGRLFAEGIDVGGCRIGHQQHVRGFDAFPAGDRGAVEGVAGDELVFVEMRDRNRDVLLLAAGIGETEINEFDFVVRNFLHDVLGRSHR